MLFIYICLSYIYVIDIYGTASAIPASGRSLSLSLWKEDDGCFGGAPLLTGSHCTEE